MITLSEQELSNFAQGVMNDLNKEVNEKEHDVVMPRAANEIAKKAIEVEVARNNSLETIKAETRKLMNANTPTADVKTAIKQMVDEQKTMLQDKYDKALQSIENTIVDIRDNFLFNRTYKDAASEQLRRSDFELQMNMMSDEAILTLVPTLDRPLSLHQWHTLNERVKRAGGGTDYEYTMLELKERHHIGQEYKRGKSYATLQRAKHDLGQMFLFHAVDDKGEYWEFDKLPQELTKGYQVTATKNVKWQ